MTDQNKSTFSRMSRNGWKKKKKKKKKKKSVENIEVLCFSEEEYNSDHIDNSLTLAAEQLALKNSKRKFLLFLLFLNKCVSKQEIIVFG